MHTISVLMSTYNGERYLCQQIDSILGQEGVEVNLLVRDDGSTDNTLDILESYAQKGQLKWYQGENLKSARSFLKLLQDSDKCDFYAFADQDDYWEADKLKVAIEYLLDYGEDTYALYLAQPQAADQNLNPLPTIQFKPLNTFGESLVYRFAMGCTMVMNNKLRDVIISYEQQYPCMHDLWTYTIAHAIGAKVIWDDTPHTLNRQHGNNVVGLGEGLLEIWSARLRRLCGKEEERYHQNAEIRKAFRDLMPQENMDTIDLFVQAKHSFMKRLKLVTSPKYRCSNRMTYLLFLLSAAINRY